MDGLRRLRDRLEGPPPALPQALDRLVEAWWSLPPRGRLLLALVAALGVLTPLALGTARSPWGGPVPVHLAVRDLPPGHLVQPGDVRQRDWPEALAPDPVEVVGRRLGTGVPAGSPVTGAHLARPGPAAGLGPARVAVPLPADVLPVGASELGPGQRLDLLAAGPRPLARAATVLAVHDSHLWIAVSRAEAPAVAEALDRGSLSIALLPGAED